MLPDDHDPERDTVIVKFRGGRALLGAAAVVAAFVPLVLAGGPPAQADTAVQGQWTVRTVAPGVEVRAGTLRDATAAPSWTVTVRRPSTARLTGAPVDAEIGPSPWALDTQAKLRAAGYEPRLEAVAWPDYADTPRGTMGWRVRIGSYAAKDTAQSTATALTGAGFHAAVEWTGYDADQPADIESIHVAVIDPSRFTGTVEGTHDGDVTRRETTSAVAAKLGSLVGVNGGFFVLSDDDGVQGTQAGLGVYDGQLASMAAGSRAALLLKDGGHHVSVANLSSEATARAGGSTYAVQGVNRLPGTVRSCGRPGAVPSSLPWQDVTCHETNDLVLFTTAFKAALPTGAGTQAVLDAQGRVVSLGGRGGTVPAGGSVLQGIGTAATWLTAHATPGQSVAVGETVRDGSGQQLALGPHDSVVSAAPVLVRARRVVIDARAEGTLDVSDPSFGYTWSNVREPRTMAGVDAYGRLLLVTVDGHRNGGSEGFTLSEAAHFMQSLGAVQAMNLDGGGSSTFTVNGVLTNRPSDAAGERAVGDTLQVLPGAAG
ncbi:phosphodiester glycosidase family protein [Streptomyces sp. HPF1205]|uniref:phosphodiester glycosidase family protein n=1 Tax=Streptomyces sp. HPF1205 TaxID=2873262 RepID=UPI001CECAAF0|nr:phosphodiester glycosidase family protein [Streptomyces sp. HPF1205]